MPRWVQRRRNWKRTAGKEGCDAHHAGSVEMDAHDGYHAALVIASPPFWLDTRAVGQALVTEEKRGMLAEPTSEVSLVFCG